MKSQIYLSLIGCTVIVVAGVLGGRAVPPAKPATAAETQPSHPFRDNVMVGVTDEFLIVHSDGIPDHETGKFPNEHGYHYHVTSKFPYIIGGYHGEPEKSDVDRRPPRGGRPAGPPGPPPRDQ